MKKVIFFDVDGTLINSAGVVPKSAKEALRKVRQAGHQLVICTGRSSHQSPQWMYDDFDGIINSAGARVAYKGKVVYDYFVPRDHVKRAREVLEAAGGVLVAQTDERTILSKEGYDYMVDHLTKLGRSRERINILLGNPIISSNMEDYDFIRKFFYHRSQETVDQIAEKLGDIFTVEAASFSKNAPDCGEICSKGISKAWGMKKYLEIQGLSRDCTIAVGDGPNDLDMLSFANIGVAMGNGRDDVKALADFVTKDIDDDGIAYAMQELGLLG